MRHLAACLLLMIFTAPAISQPAIPRLARLDVQHYTFQLELSDQTDQIKASATVRIKFLQPLSSFTLDLVTAGEDGKGMNVSSVREGENPVEYRHEGEQLTIFPKPAVGAGQERTFRIEYQGIPADGLIIDRNKYGDRTFFGDNWPNRAHHWLPCIDHPSDKASVDFIVTAPDHYQVVANGIQIEETNLDDETKLTHWREDVPLPMKVAVFGAARFGVQLAGEVEGIPVTSWVYRQDREAGYYDYSLATGVLQFFIGHIGPYPYRKLANVQSKTRYGGMENASNIFYYENSVDGKQSEEDLIAHEIAHQWFGNSASEQNWFHIWLSEGFATYGADLYMEHQYGRDRLAERLQSERQQVVSFSKRKMAPIVDTAVTDWNALLNPNSYQKGAWVLHMLRRQVGEAAFWNGLRQYYAQYAGRNALTADFQRTMEAASGQELSWFFQQWIYRPGQPQLKVEWDKPKRKRLRFKIRQLQDGPAFVFPLDIRAIGADGATAQTWTVEVKEKTMEATVKCKFEPGKIVLDPETWLLFSE
ncbi:MAG: M1 family metallopeptidase [Phaeodactylibacter sp.]|nr:M1 family metallopeptidase [Phaeodactylibacter sp.]MCB9052186.1 M1 family metallopeptidase [Lewinellaceae bacterium]